MDRGCLDVLSTWESKEPAVSRLAAGQKVSEAEEVAWQVNVLPRLMS